MDLNNTRLTSLKLRAGLFVSSFLCGSGADLWPFNAGYYCNRFAFSTSPGGGAVLLNKVYTGRFRPEVQLPLFYTIDRKDTPFVYLLLKNGTPLYLPT